MTQLEVECRRELDKGLKHLSGTPSETFNVVPPLTVAGSVESRCDLIESLSYLGAFQPNKLRKYLLPNTSHDFLSCARSPFNFIARPLSNPSHAPVLRAKFQSQSISVPLGKRRYRRVSTNTTSPVILQPILPLLQCRSRRLHPAPIQRTLQRGRSMVCIITMGEVRIQKPTPSRPFSTHPTLRLLGFGACLLGAAVCFFVAFLTLPFLAINPAKFALAFRCA